MDNSGLVLTGAVCTAFFAFWAIFFFWQERRLKDLRTLKLGRLRLGFWLSLLVLANFLVLVLIDAFPRNLTNLGLLILVAEIVTIGVVPMLLGLVIPLMVVVLTVKMWRRETKSFANLLLPIVVLFFLVIDIIYNRIGHLSDSYIWLKVLAYTYPVLAIYLAWQFLVFFVSSVVYGKRVRQFEAQYYVVHGAGLIGGDKVGNLLANRIKAAVAASKENTIFVMSGGKGDDEHSTEAEAMKRYAIDELQIDESRILKEDQSRTTFENLENVKSMIGSHFRFFTSDFHVFRTALFAAQLELSAEGGSGGKTAFYYRVPAFIREFIAVMNSERKKHILIISLIVLFFILLAIFMSWIYPLTKI